MTQGLVLSFSLYGRLLQPIGGWGENPGLKESRACDCWPPRRPAPQLPLWTAKGTQGMSTFPGSAIRKLGGPWVRLVHPRASDPPRAFTISPHGLSSRRSSFDGCCPSLWKQASKTNTNTASTQAGRLPGPHPALLLWDPEAPLQRGPLPGRGRARHLLRNPANLLLRPHDSVPSSVLWAVFQHNLFLRMNQDPRSGFLLPRLT